MYIFIAIYIIMHIFCAIFQANYGNFAMYLAFEMNFIFFNLSLNLDFKNFKQQQDNIV